MIDPTSMLPNADRPRRLTADERDRLRRQLGFDCSPSSTDDDQVLEPVPLRPSGRRPRRWLHTAAAGVVVLALAVVAWQGRTTTDTVADQPLSACAIAIPPLAAALDTWGGLDQWLLSDGGEPDVGSRIANLLDALAGAQPEQATLGDEADAVRSALEPPAADATMAERLDADEARDQVLRNALELAMETVAALADPSCDAASLQPG